MVVGPGIKVKTAEGQSLPSYRNFNKIRSHVPIEEFPVHAEVGRGIAVADETRRDSSHDASPSIGDPGAR